MGERRLLTGSKAMAEAVSLEMKRDENVFLLGEDIGMFGGIFGATPGLFQEFGPERVIDTPISETAIVGAAVGAAAEGMRPIAELMFVDFIGVCMDQISNQMAKIQYMSGGNVKLPMVLKASVGGGISDAAQHSQTHYGTFAHIPGLKVVAPSTPHDLKGMMISAIREDNPVVFLYHKLLQGVAGFKQIPANIGHVPEESYTVPLDKAKVVREGKDVTIVGIQMTMHYALEAAEKLAAQGIDAEVIDLRSIAPIDKDTIIESVRKTHRLVVVDEDYLTCGLTAEIAALVVEEAFYDLADPVRRIAIRDVPIPFSRSLEDFILPGPEDIYTEVMDMMNAKVLK
ncbi:alpha-ketoacid dehydrogenase subunit beta [Sporosarcina obsidiansis]|uniref:alpha-ketoacid dehydrogenase subunit beta n=1 Tax=Sporosarcina obsidiansis TaxID=2660748 RepID=UPI0038B51FFC